MPANFLAHASFQCGDEEWDAYVFEDGIFSQHFGEDLAGVTIGSERKMGFAVNALSLPLVLHELTHAYFRYLCLESVPDLTYDQMEEAVAEFMSVHALHLIGKARAIYKALSYGQKERAKRTRIPKRTRSGTQKHQSSSQEKGRTPRKKGRT